MTNPSGYPRSDRDDSAVAHEAPVSPPGANPHGMGYPPMHPPHQPAFSPASPSAPAAPRSGGGAGKWVALALVAALLGGGVGSAVTMATMPQATSGTGQTTPVIEGSGDAVDWASVADAVAPAVVSITVSTGNSGGEGSGVVLDEAGHIATNHHVISGGDAGQIMVTLHDHTIHTAQIVGSDAGSDIAVIKLDNPPSNLTPIAFGDVSSIQVGDPVMAVGNPLGLSGSVTTGIVSALNRPVQSAGSPEESSPWGTNETSEEAVVTNAIQTSAPINPGNSGGALVDESGRLIGVTSSIATLGGPEGGSGNIGIGFAIPADQVRTVADELIANGVAPTAKLGVTTSDGIGRLDGQAVVGAEVQEVESGSPADEAGLETGDVITSMDEVPVTGSVSLASRVRAQAVGTEVKLQVSRGDEVRDVDVTLTSR